MNMENITVKSCCLGSLNHISVNDPLHIKRVPYTSVVQATEGFYSFSLHEQPQKDLKTGESFIAPAHALQTITHHADTNSGKMSARWVFMDIIVNDHIPFDRVFTLPAFPSPVLCEEIGNALDRIFSAENIITKKIGCYELINLLMPYATEIQNHNPIIDEVLAYIDRHYTEHLTVDSLAAAAKTSPSNLFGLFKRVMGTTPIEYCNSIRLSHACGMLSQSEHSVEEIARLCGVGDSSYFNKLFKKKFAVTPNAYRNMQRKTEATE